MEEGLQFRVILDLDHSSHSQKVHGMECLLTMRLLLFEVPVAIELANRKNEIININLRIATPPRQFFF